MFFYITVKPINGTCFLVSSILDFGNRSLKGKYIGKVVGCAFFKTSSICPGILFWNFKFLYIKLCLWYYTICLPPTHKRKYKSTFTITMLWWKISMISRIFFCLYKYLNLPMPTYDSKREWCRKTDMLKCELFMSKSKFNVLSTCKCRSLTCKMLMSTCDIT